MHTCAASVPRAHHSGAQGMDAGGAVCKNTVAGYHRRRQGGAGKYQKRARLMPEHASTLVLTGVGLRQWARERAGIQAWRLSTAHCAASGVLGYTTPPEPLQFVTCTSGHILCTPSWLHRLTMDFYPKAFR